MFLNEDIYIYNKIIQIMNATMVQTISNKQYFMK